LTFLNSKIDFIILKTDDEQFTLTTKKSLHIIFNTTKTELIWFGTRRLLKKATENDLTLHLDSGSVHPVSAIRDCCFFAPCTNILTYLLTYLLTYVTSESCWTVNCLWSSIYH